MNEKIFNARITDASIFFVDSFYITFKITVQTDIYECDIGHWNLGTLSLGEAELVNGYPKGLSCMAEIMRIVGVNKWEDLKGKYVRIKTNGDKSIIHSIGNILENDLWFDIWEYMGSDRFLAPSSAYLHRIK